MNAGTLQLIRASLTAVAVAGALSVVACDGGPSSPANTATPDVPGPPAAVDGGASGDAAPDTSGMGQLVLEKINANPAIEGKATLVEFRQKSISTQALGDSLMSAVVEFEGLVTFSDDVQWSWQGPTKAGEPQKFEARAEYLNQGKGWELVQPLGIYPL
ncbi:MAG: hypothetical protein ACRETI_01050 [Steroidobacteraceae bacterium]